VSESTKRKMLAIMATPEDLDALRNIFGEMAGDNECDGHELAKRFMKAIHRCRKKHGFIWEN